MKRTGNKLNLQEMEGSCNEPFNDLLKISGEVVKKHTERKMFTIM